MERSRTALALLMVTFACGLLAAGFLGQLSGNRPAAMAEVKQSQAAQPTGAARSLVYQQRRAKVAAERAERRRALVSQTSMLAADGPPRGERETQPTTIVAAKPASVRVPAFRSRVHAQRTPARLRTAEPAEALQSRSGAPAPAGKTAPAARPAWRPSLDAYTIQGPVLHYRQDMLPLTSLAIHAVMCREALAVCERQETEDVVEPPALWRTTSAWQARSPWNAPWLLGRGGIDYHSRMARDFVSHRATLHARLPQGAVPQNAVPQVRAAQVDPLQWVVDFFPRLANPYIPAGKQPAQQPEGASDAVDLPVLREAATGVSSLRRVSTEALLDVFSPQSQHPQSQILRLWLPKAAGAQKLLWPATTTPAGNAGAL